MNITLANALLRKGDYDNAFLHYVSFFGEKREINWIVSTNIAKCLDNSECSLELLFTLFRLLKISNVTDVKKKKDDISSSRKLGDYLSTSLHILALHNFNEHKINQDFYDLLFRNVEDFLNNRKFVELYILLKFLYKDGIKERFVLQALAISALKLNSYSHSLKIWQEYYELYDTEAEFAKSKFLKIKGGDNLAKFEPIGNDFNPTFLNKKICVYTALFGDYDSLPPNLAPSADVEFICFTDKIQNIPGWKFVITDKKFENPIQANRYYKLQPHIHLSDFDYSIYIDSNIIFLADISLIIKKCIGLPFAGWCHPERADVYSEIDAIISNFRHRPEKMLEQYVYFKTQQLPIDVGMIEACFLWRDHKNKSVNTMMEKWWSFVKDRGNRDQPAIAYLMHKENIRPRVFSNVYGNTRHNDFFYKLPHLGNPLKLSNPNDSEEIFQKDFFIKNRKRNLVWIYREDQKNVASTFMRGYQLSQIAANRYDQDCSVNYFNESSLSNVFDSIVILTKGFLKKATLEEIDVLKSNNNVVCVDFVDDPERLDIVNSVDVLIASSISQLLHYKLTYRDKLSHMITHHTDPDILINNDRLKRPSVGYFGELVNAKWKDELKGKVSFILTNTKTRTKEWIPELNNYNCHYAVRNRREIDGFKPFLKGYTAAHCNSIIIVPKFEGDARYYLTSDYPYLLKDDSLESVIEKLEIFYDGFGSKEHIFAKDIMDSVRVRSSINAIFLEIENLRQLLC